MKVEKYEQLVAWQKAMNLVEAVYVASGAFPRQEVYGLTSQVRRAVVSVPSNIAEGQARSSSKDFLRYLRIAQGSLGEVETQLMIAGRLQYINGEEMAPLLAAAREVGRLVRGLSAAIERRVLAQGEAGTSH